MKWIELIIHTTSEAQDLVSNLLLNNGISGTSVLDRSYIPNLNAYGKEWELYDSSILSNMPSDVEVHAWLEYNDNCNESIEQIKKELKSLKNNTIPLGTLLLETKIVDDEEWKDTWKQYYKPLRVGNNIIIKPSWEEYKPLKTDLIIELDPGMAFGTGSHATTFMCLTLLEKYVTINKTVVDVGTGSGILAIAAAKLGATNILAIDINKDAVEVAKENIKSNGLAKNIIVKHGDLIKVCTEKYDIVVANIIADAVMMLSPDVKSILNDKGFYIVSGILKTREAEVINNANMSNFELVDSMEMDEWVALVFKQRSIYA